MFVVPVTLLFTSRKLVQCSYKHKFDLVCICVRASVSPFFKIQWSHYIVFVFLAWKESHDSNSGPEHHGGIVAIVYVSWFFPTRPVVWVTHKSCILFPFLQSRGEKAVTVFPPEERFSVLKSNGKCWGCSLVTWSWLAFSLMDTRGGLFLCNELKC